MFTTKVLGINNVEYGVEEWSFDEAKLFAYKGDYKELEVTTMEYLRTGAYLGSC